MPGIQFLTTDQEILRDASAKFVEATCPLEVVRSLIGDDLDMPAGYLRSAAALGWFAMLVPESAGGGSVSGSGLCDAALIAEVRGRTLQPGPFVAMNVVADAVGSRDPAGAIAAGDVVATWVPDGVVASPSPDGWELSGRCAAVSYGHVAEWFLVGGLLVPAGTPGITATRVESLDLTQRVAAVTFDGVRVPSAAFLDVDPDRALEVACVLTTVETVGAMDELFARTCAYAKERIAFGRPIGSFQAVKHQLADLALGLECAKAVTAAAITAVQERSDDASQIVSIAKAWVADAGISLAQGCFQVFGGIGFTWEHDLHLFLRRITMNAGLFGSADWHRERICALQGV